MAVDWRETTLGEVVELKRGYDLPQQARSRGKVPLVSSSGITDYQSVAMVTGPGVVTGRYGTLGEVFYIAEDFWPLNTTLYVRDFKGNDPRFISYFLRRLDFLAYSDKAAVPGLNRNHLHQAEVRVPSDVAEQRAIAHVLGTLDNKIELNRRVNETLEAIARLIFKSWFVDFAPARAKASGEPPESIYRRLGLTPDLLTLFPDRFQDSELGEIPEGWTTTSVYDLATYINGAAYRAFQPNEQRRGLPIIKIAELKAGVTPQTRYSDVEMQEKYKISRGDLLFSWSGNPDTSIDTFVWAHGPAWLNQHIFRVVPHSPEERSFVLMTLKHLRPVLAEIARNKQTTGLGHVTAEDMRRLKIVRPSTPLLNQWNQTVDPLLEQAFRGELEGRTLAALRDALLPKLLSGELRVPAADEA